MPRDNHPRERQARKLARRKPTRPPFDRVLIVTEGSRTEPRYFEDIRRQKRITPAHVAVLPSAAGTEPRRIVDFAEACFGKTKAFDRVYAVFDRDSHRTYSDALQRAARLDGSLRNDEGKPVRFLATPSVPCFELWLLLHYQDIHSFSDRHEIIRKLKTHIERYDKDAVGIYATTEPRIDEASRRARYLRSLHSAAPGVDPYTDVDTLLEFLRTLTP